MTKDTKNHNHEGPHCENCGQAVDPHNTDEGYTHCCNERVCYGGSHTDRFGTPNDFKRACCWAKADEMFEAEGRQAPEGSCRLAR